jgi:hypothetical protein
VSFVVVARNPRSKALFAIVKSPDQDVVEFATADEAKRVANKMPWAKAWLWEIVEIDL